MTTRKIAEYLRVAIQESPTDVHTDDNFIEVRDTNFPLKHSAVFDFKCDGERYSVSVCRFPSEKK